MGNVLRTITGFVAFMVLFILGAHLFGAYGAIAGFITGVGAMSAIGMGKVGFAVRPLKGTSDF